jgi:hypothetical protein
VNYCTGHPSQAGDNSPVGVESLDVDLDPKEKKMNPKTLVAAVLCAVSLSSNVALASTAGCTFGDLTGVTVNKCAVAAGNVISNSKGDLATVSSILSSFDVSGATGTWLEKIDGLKGNQTIDFKTLLSGNTIVALHFGNSSALGNSTAFYRFDAGTSVDSFKTILAASSNAAIYVTSAVPEPETYAMLLAGLGFIGTIARRRRARQA